MSVEDISSGGPQNLKSHPKFSQNRQTVGTQLNVAGNIIFGGYSHDRTSQPPLDRIEALKRYLFHVISANRSLQLQGIRSAGKLISIELEKIYVTLCTTATTSRAEEEQWLRKEADVLPGETLRPAIHSHGPQPKPTSKMELKVQQALRRHHRLVVVGDPGCGKTTLLSYLALTYARNWVGAKGLLQKRLTLKRPRLPILLPLRTFAVHLQHAHPDKSLDGPALLLNYLHKFFANQEIRMPADFFTCPLEKGTCVVLLDGMDEVAQPKMRYRIARIIEAFTRNYPDNRYVVTSRIKGYSDSARLAEAYTVAKVRDFDRNDMQRFIIHWNRAVEAVLAGEDSATSRKEAQKQSAVLLKAIDANDRVRELAVNPLLLTVIALVQRYRAKLPERRTELYDEAVEVLLGKWDEAKGLECKEDDLDAGDCRSLLEPIALSMMEQRRREIDAETLHRLLAQRFRSSTLDDNQAEKNAARFLTRINERSGLMTERGQGIYSFSHLTFQEHLAARAIAGRKDYIPYTLARIHQSWWREVVLLEAGCLGAQSPERVTDLIQAVIHHKKEPHPFYNLVLAADCLRDVGRARTTGDLWRQVRERLQTVFERPLIKKTGRMNRFLQAVRIQPRITDVIENRALAAEALARMESNISGTQPAFWHLPWGEPVWAKIPAGEFYMGEGKEQHKLFLDTFLMAKTPVTNAQYYLFTQASGHQVPKHWSDGRPPRDLTSHPVRYVAFHDALAYCNWLTEKTGRSITLPSEAQWEKASRGIDARIYPWGNTWNSAYCNTDELELGQTTPVGIFPEGQSPYGCLDMVGNVWEWTGSLWGRYLYDPNDGRKDINMDGGKSRRVLRGGFWSDPSNVARCAFRYSYTPNNGLDFSGFRVSVFPITSAI